VAFGGPWAGSWLWKPEAADINIPLTKVFSAIEVKEGHTQILNNKI
jgi:hypothetical protein